MELVAQDERWSWLLHMIVAKVYRYKWSFCHWGLLSKVISLKFIVETLVETRSWNSKLKVVGRSLLSKVIFSKVCSDRWLSKVEVIGCTKVILELVSSLLLELAIQCMKVVIEVNFRWSLLSRKWLPELKIDHQSWSPKGGARVSRQRRLSELEIGHRS